MLWVGNSQRKNAAMLDSDDDSSSVSSSSTSRTDHISVSGNEEVHFDQDGLLDQALDALDEKMYLFFFLIYRWEKVLVLTYVSTFQLPLEPILF